MVYTCEYKSPLGKILLAADETGLTGLWFEGHKYFADTLPNEKISLLKLEHADMSRLFVPKKGTAL